jgi:hypothetical protein
LCQLRERCVNSVHDPSGYVGLTGKDALQAFSWYGRRFLVIGVDGGIGRVTCSVMAGLRASLAMSDRAALKELARSIRIEGSIRPRRGSDGGNRGAGRGRPARSTASSRRERRRLRELGRLAAGETLRASTAFLRSS